MVFFQLDIVRFIQIYIVQGSVGLFFLYLAYKILKRDTKRLNLIFSSFYICGATGVLLNFVYAPLTDELVVLTLYYMTVYFFLFSPIFLVVFMLILLKSEKVINTKKQLIIIIIYGVSLFGMIFIPEGVIINASTDWKPVWSIPYFIYTASIFSVMVIFSGLYYSMQIYKQFEDEQLKKKWKYFIFGICGIYTLVYGTLISNTINLQDFRTIWSLTSLGLALIPPYLIYIGVGRSIEK